jgi:poly(3-hydroxybutyrate) depolymerase
VRSSLRLAALAVGAALSLLVAAAIGSEAAKADPKAPLESAGCTLAGRSGQADRTGEFSSSTTDGEGRTRSYWVHLPTDYHSKRPYSLVFVFHGANANAMQSRSWGLQQAGAAARDAIVVFPNGISFQSYGIGWDDRSNGYDLPFFDHMLKDLEADYCVDETQVFAAGFSWGGDFAVALACNRGDVFAAIAINSATDEFKDKSNYLTYQDLPCPTHRHPPLRFEHAAAGDSQYPAPYFATTSRLLQSLNSCGTRAASAPAAAGESCVTYQGCKSEYVECSFEARLGHVLPPNWAVDTWSFFASR